MTQPISSKIVKTQVDNITKNTLRHILSNRFLGLIGASKMQHLKRLQLIEKISQLITKSLNRWKSTLLPWKLVTNPLLFHQGLTLLMKCGGYEKFTTFYIKVDYC